MFKYAAAAVASMLLAGAAQAAFVVDGVRDANYGTRTATVTYDPAAPDSNFGTPTNTTRWSSYDIFLRSDESYVYGFFQAAGDQPIEATFANLYFDVDPANGNGSDIGFELSPGSTRLFVPGRTGNQARTDILTAAGNNGLNFEVAIPVYYFNSAVDGANYYPGQSFAGGQAVLRLSQSFGYSVAGGATYGANRLGTVTIPAAADAAVPEPATWVSMIGGFALLGAAARRRTRAALRLA